MEGFSNLFFVVIAIVIFIVRAIVQTQASKKKPPPARKPETPGSVSPVKSGPKISVHFEDDSDDYRGPQAAAMAVRRSSPKPAKRSLNQPLPPPKPVITAASAETRIKAPPLPESNEIKGFPYNLSRLPPLKQAVIMAEILGPPKGVQ